MNLENYEVQSEFLRDLTARVEARGEARGRLQALAQAVLRVLDARALSVTDEQRAAITTCPDLNTLDAWLQRAVTVTDTDEIFAS